MLEKLIKKKRQMNPIENKLLECCKQEFYKSFLNTRKLRTYESYVKHYEKHGIDTGEHRKIIRYYKNREKEYDKKQER